MVHPIELLQIPRWKSTGPPLSNGGHLRPVEPHGVKVPARPARCLAEASHRWKAGGGPAVTGRGVIYGMVVGQY